MSVVFGFISLLISDYINFWVCKRQLKIHQIKGKTGYIYWKVINFYANISETHIYSFSRFGKCTVIYTPMSLEKVSLNMVERFITSEL